MSKAASKSKRGLGGWGLIAVPYFWLLIFFLAPFLIVFKISLSQVASCDPALFSNVRFG
jgi:putrescine transport system permease protein